MHRPDCGRNKRGVMTITMTLQPHRRQQQQQATCLHPALAKSSPNGVRLFLINLSVDNRQVSCHDTHDTPHCGWCFICIYCLGCRRGSISLHHVMPIRVPIKHTLVDLFLMQLVPFFFTTWEHYYT
ncbi:unnamed protein product, partial [Pylaiella littoralis]